ncbi:FMN reductase (NADH) NtaB [compost metagenome]
MFECGTEHRYEGGDHLILVGRVLRMEVAQRAMQPLLFHRGRYAELLSPETV